MQTLMNSRFGAPHNAPSQADHPASIIPLSCTATVAPRTPKMASRARHAAAGFTLIELMIAVAVAGVLSSVAYPSFMDQVQRVRRSDAVVTMMQVQWAQERWRANSTAYGTMAQIGMGTTSTAGHYTLQMSANTESGYEILAMATGPQARDTTCANLKLSMQGANPVFTSGPDASATNPVDTNRRCWSL